jgi:hypothetical protein
MLLSKFFFINCSICLLFCQNFKGLNVGLNTGGYMISNSHQFRKQTGTDEPGSVSQKTFGMILSGFAGYNYVTSSRKIIGVDMHIGKSFGNGSGQMRDKNNATLYEYSTKPSIHFGGTLVFGMLLNQSSSLYVKAGYGIYKISLEYLKSSDTTLVPNQKLNISFKAPILGLGLIYRFGQKSFFGTEYNFYYATSKKVQEQSSSRYELIYAPLIHHVYFKIGCFF